MTTRYARVESAQVEAIGPVWAAFSALTGDTMMLNDESAAILEVLAAGPASTAQVCATLAQDMDDTALSDEQASVLFDTVSRCWGQLVEAGLVRVDPALAAGA